VGYACSPQQWPGPWVTPWPGLQQWPGPRRNPGRPGAAPDSGHPRQWRSCGGRTLPRPAPDRDDHDAGLHRSLLYHRGARSLLGRGRGAHRCGAPWFLL